MVKTICVNLHLADSDTLCSIYHELYKLPCMIKYNYTKNELMITVAFQTHPGRQAFISSGSKEPRSALESRRVSLGAHWVDSRESSLLRRLERGREIGL